MPKETKTDKDLAKPKRLKPQSRASKSHEIVNEKAKKRASLVADDEKFILQEFFYSTDD